MTTPLTISVITATWNCADTIRDCINSIESQTYPHIEHIVIDGASDDGTVDLLRINKNKLAIFISEPDKGIYDALNKGIVRSTSDVVGFLHADDVYADPHVLARIAEAFADPTVQAVYGDLEYVNKSDLAKVIRYWKSAPFRSSSLKWGWMPPHPTLYIRREWYERIGGFDTHYRIAADYFSILKLFSQPDFKAVYMPQVLVKMRIGGASNRSLKNIIRKSREDLNALRRSGVGGIYTLLCKNLSKLLQFRFT